MPTIDCIDCEGKACKGVEVETTPDACPRRLADAGSQGQGHVPQPLRPADEPLLAAEVVQELVTVTVFAVENR